MKVEMSIFKFKNVPNFLTFTRLIISFILPVCLFYFLPFKNFLVNLLLSALFIFFSLTDFLDGYLARKYNLETNLGKALDPIADKFFILFPLISLLAIKKIYFLWVIILIGRELFIMGLRQIALESNFDLKVSFTGKVKTFFQIIMIAVIIVNPYWNFEATNVLNIIESSLILITIFLSLLSAHQYYRVFRLKYNF